MNFIRKDTFMYKNIDKNIRKIIKFECKYKIIKFYLFVLLNN